MVTAAGVYVFLLGLASGVALLTITSFRRVSPRWLKWLLIATGLFVISRYVTLALYTTLDAPTRVWPLLRHCWFASSVGLTLPSIMVIDQLLRHPAMSPRKLLLWFAPFLAIYGAVIALAPVTPVPDRVVGWTLRLAPGWRMLLSIAQGLFVVGFVGIGALLMRKVPSAPIRLALLGVMCGHVYLGVDGVVLALGRWYFRPFLFSEIVALLAIWHAYDTSGRLQGGLG